MSDQPAAELTVIASPVRVDSGDSSPDGDAFANSLQPEIAGILELGLNSFGLA